MATSDMYKNSYTGKDNYIYLNDSTSAAKFPGASIFADGAAYTSDGSSWDATTVKSYTAEELPNPATLAPRTTVVLTGTFAADVTSVSLTVDFVKGVKSWTGTVVSANDPVDADGLPNGVTWIKV